MVVQAWSGNTHEAEQEDCGFQTLSQKEERADLTLKPEYLSHIIWSSALI